MCTNCLNRKHEYNIFIFQFFWALFPLLQFVSPVQMMEGLLENCAQVKMLLQYFYSSKCESTCVKMYLDKSQLKCTLSYVTALHFLMGEG